MIEEIDICKSYKFEKTLINRIEYLFTPDTKYRVVVNKWGRFTAVFPRYFNPEIHPSHFEHAGFMTEK